MVGAAFFTGGLSLSLTAFGSAFSLSGTAITSFLATTGAGFVMSGVGTLLGQRATGVQTTSRNPLHPWQVIYGRTKVGGNIVYLEEVGSNNRILLLVIALACHPCQEIEQVWLNNKKLQMRLNTSFNDSSNPNGFMNSFNPPQGIWNIQTISRVNDVVTVTFAQNPNSLYTGFNGETLWIRNTIDNVGGNSFNGYWPVQQTGPNSFTFTAGGPQGAGRSFTGTIKSTWPVYNNNVTTGFYLGNQTQASGIVLGNTAGYWTNDCLLSGRTYVTMKLEYDSSLFNGMPEISFVVKGKNDIYDPRTGTTGYSNNPALCIADYLAHPVFGFGAHYGAEIPIDELIAAANVCDEQVPLALGGTENRYSCDGYFDVSVPRGDVLQNLLTSCGGRLTYNGGQFVIQPAGWYPPANLIDIADGDSGQKMLVSDQGLVVHPFNNPPAPQFVPDSSGTVKDQMTFIIGMLNAYVATQSTVALSMAKLCLDAIFHTIYRDMVLPDIVDDTHIWPPHWLYNVKQPMLDANGDILQVGQNMDNVPALRGLSPSSGEIDATGDSFNWCMRAYLLAAQVLDGVSPVSDIHHGYGDDYGFDYGNPVRFDQTTLSFWQHMALATMQEARYAYNISNQRQWIRRSINKNPFAITGSSATSNLAVAPAVSCDSSGNIVITFVNQVITNANTRYSVTGINDAFNTGDYTIFSFIGNTKGDSFQIQLILNDGSTDWVFTTTAQSDNDYNLRLNNTDFLNGSGEQMPYGTPVHTATVNIPESLGGNESIVIKGVRQYPNKSVPYGNGGAIPYTATYQGPLREGSRLGWEGPVYIGYQSPWAIKQLGDENNVATNVQLLYDAQMAWGSTTLAILQPDVIRFVISGANPQTINAPITIDRSGNGSAQITLDGLNEGTDSIQAFLDSKSLSSNIARYAWNPLSGGIGLTTVNSTTMVADGSSFFHGLSAVIGQQTFNSLMFNSHELPFDWGDPHESQNVADPIQNNPQTPDGLYAGDIPVQGSGGSRSINMVFTGQFVVTSAGPVNFQAILNASFVIGVRGASYVSGPQHFGPITTTPMTGIQSLAGFNEPGYWPGGNQAHEFFTLNFPAPGVYDYEICFTAGNFHEKMFCLIANNAMIKQVQAPTTATGDNPTGQLALAPVSGGGFVGGSQDYTLTVTGVSVPPDSDTHGTGPLAPVFYFDQQDVSQFGTVNTFGFIGVDDASWVGYQLRPLVELTSLMRACTGSESYYTQASTVVNKLLSWFDTNWTDTYGGPPTRFTQTGASRDYTDPHAVGLLMRAVLDMDMLHRPSGNASGTMDATLQSLFNKSMLFFNHWFLQDGPMKGTFCTNPTGAQDWFGFWHGELLTTCSQLYKWAINANINDLTTASEALAFVYGLIDFAVGNTAHVDPDLGYTVTDLRGGIKWKPKLPKHNLYNGVKGTYVSEANQWQQSDFPTYCQDALHGYSNGSPAYDYDANWEADKQRLFKDVQLPFTTSVSTAQRLAKIELLRVRQQGRGVLQGMMSMYKSTPLDVVMVSFAPFNWQNKIVEIANTRLVQERSDDGDAVFLGTEVDIAETSKKVYDWDTKEELSSQGYSYLPNQLNTSPDA